MSLSAPPDATRQAMVKMIENGEGNDIIQNNGTEHEYKIAVQKFVDNYMEEKITGHKVESQTNYIPEHKPFNRDEKIEQTIQSYKTLDTHTEQETCPIQRDML